MRWFALALSATLLFSSVFSAARSSTVGIEWGMFRTLCSVVNIGDTKDALENSIDRKLLDKSVADVIEARLRERKLNFAVEYGPQCFPGKVGIAPYQLSLQFHATLALNADQRLPVIVALTMHKHWQSNYVPTHEFPTKILFCQSSTELTACLAKHVSAYFEEAPLRVIDRAQELLKGAR